MSAQRACSVGDIEPAGALGVQLKDADGKTVPVVIARDSEGGWHALNDMCSHGQVNLSEGDVEGCAIECWAHGAAFNLRTGEPTLPATIPVAVYPVVIEGDDILVDVDAPVTAA